MWFLKVYFATKNVFLRNAPKLTRYTCVVKKNFEKRIYWDVREDKWIFSWCFHRKLPKLGQQFYLTSNFCFPGSKHRRIIDTLYWKEKESKKECRVKERRNKKWTEKTQTNPYRNVTKLLNFNFVQVEGWLKRNQIYFNILQFNCFYSPFSCKFLPRKWRQKS